MLLQADEGVAIDDGGEAVEPERLIEAEAEHDALPRCCPGLELLELPLRPLAAAERGEVARQARHVPPAQAANGREGADADPEIVAAEPVAEVVAGPQVAFGVGAAEVRGLVPAVTGVGEGSDDALEVVLHRLALALELLAMGVREPRSRFGLELVRR